MQHLSPTMGATMSQAKRRWAQAKEKQKGSGSFVLCNGFAITVFPLVIWFISWWVDAIYWRESWWSIKEHWRHLCHGSWEKEEYRSTKISHWRCVQFCVLVLCFIGQMSDEWNILGLKVKTKRTVYEQYTR